MKENIHPNYKAIKVTCSCGNSFTTSSTTGKDLHVEVCNKCHPFYTGEQRVVDTQGRVDSFKNRFGNFANLARKKKEDK
jgi:large subunit ribosomal protein L31